MKIKCWFTYIARSFGGLHVGIRYQFPLSITSTEVRHQLDIGLVCWEFHVAFLIKKKDKL